MQKENGDTKITYRGEDIKKGADKRKRKTEESKYNDNYKNIIIRTITTENIPEYLNREKSMDRSLIARYKCRNNMRESQYWREAGDKLCKVCGKEEMMIHDVLRECVSTREEITVGELLGEDGKT